MEFVGEELGTDAVVVFRKPRFLAFYGGIRCLGCSSEESAENALSEYDAYGVSHVVVFRGRSSRDEKERWLSLHIAERPYRFRKAFENSMFSAYCLVHTNLP